MTQIPRDSAGNGFWTDWPLFLGHVQESVPQVLVFRTDLDETEIASSLAELSSAEQARANEYTAKKSRDTYIVCRSTVRRVLSLVLGIRPLDLEFRFGPYGKPFLATSEELQFNISHSQGLGVLAWNRGAEIGVDIECLDRVAEMEGIARRFFSPRESDQFFACEPTLRREAFFKTWTCKEAFIKAKGMGLTFGLDRFSVNVHPEEEAAVLSIEDESADDWKLSRFRPDAHIVGALAIKTPQAPELQCWRWNASEAIRGIQS